MAGFRSHRGRRRCRRPGSLLGAAATTPFRPKTERAEAAWADVQSHYQRRADLVPNLAATVQGARPFKNAIATLTQVIEARAKRCHQRQHDASNLDDAAAFQQYQQAQGELSALSRLGR